MKKVIAAGSSKKGKILMNEEPSGSPHVMMSMNIVRSIVSEEDYRNIQFASEHHITGEDIMIYEVLGPDECS